MDKLEKVEKLRERADVSYEEARQALEENGWDLLDAMVALEKSGKTENPGQQQYSTSYDQQEEYIPVKAKVEEQEKKQPGFGQSLGEALRNFIRIYRENQFCISRKENLILRVPLLLAIIVVLLTWRVSVPVLLIALVFSFRYSIEGKDDLKEVNAFMDSAGAAAESLKDGIVNARKADSARRDGDSGQSV